MVAATAKKAENSITVFRRQVIQTGSYEPAEASCSVTISVDDGTSEEEVADLITRWGSVLELSNYEALGVGYEIAEDGTVEMLAQGPDANIDNCIRETKDSFPGYVRETKIEEIPIDPQYMDFKITF